jgi:hypothetical protein
VRRNWKKIRDAIGALAGPYSSSAYELSTIPTGSILGEQNLTGSPVKPREVAGELVAFGLNDCINNDETVARGSHGAESIPRDTLLQTLSHERDPLKNWVSRA